MTVKIKALFALLATVVLWSFMVIIARVAVIDVPPLTLLFIRFIVAAAAFLPFFIYNRPWQNKAFNKLVAVSLLSTVNVTFFILGIQYTSASASQLIYAAMPILIIIIGKLFMSERYPLRRILGVLTGLAGIVFIIYLSAIEKGTTISGSLIGNLLIVIAMFGWMLYIILSKKLLKIFSPVDIGSVSVMVSFIISIPLYISEISWPHSSLIIPFNGILAGVYMGFFGTFLTYLLYQYGLKQVSPLTASFTSYIQPITTAFLEIILLGEKMTFGFFTGGLLVFFGVFISTTLEFYHRQKR